MPPTPRRSATAPRQQDAEVPGILDDLLRIDAYEVVEIDVDQADAELLALIARRPGGAEGRLAST